MGGVKRSIINTEFKSTLRMNGIHVETNPDVMEVFKKYPKVIRPKIEQLRKLIIETAEGIDGIDKIQETLKWGEPSYLVKKGSTLRIDWKDKKPNQYAMYFKCTSKLVETFKVIFKDLFIFENNRAIIFKMDDNIPEAELKQCIAVTLTYHTIKHLPLLGLQHKKTAH